MSEQANSYFTKFLMLRKPEHYSDFTLMHVEFKGDHPTFPKRAVIKLFDDASPGAFKELSLLMELSEGNFQVPKYFYHFLSKGKLYVILEYCPITLASEISQRRRTQRFWGEGEVLLYLKGILDTLNRLHIKRIVHRNINPSTLLLQDSHMKIAHFQHSKQIHMGLTNQLSSVQGFDTFLSPQLHEALRSGQSGVTYEATYKDDVWSLGRSFYDMLTLKNNEDVVSLFEEGRRGFLETIERELKGLCYSNNLTKVVCEMLAFDDASRPDAGRLLETVQSLVENLKSCSACKGVEGVVGPVTQMCHHHFCRGCCRSLIAKALSENGTLESLKCSECAQTICSSIERFLEDIQSRTQLNMLHQNNIVTCANRNCTKKYSQLTFQSGKPKAYIVSCECGMKFCSYCHTPGGHGLFGVFSRCPAISLV